MNKYQKILAGSAIVSAIILVAIQLSFDARCTRVVYCFELNTLMPLSFPVLLMGFFSTIFLIANWITHLIRPSKNKKDDSIWAWVIIGASLLLGVMVIYAMNNTP